MQLTDIIKIINYTRTLGLNRANKISSVFGMKYYEFGNPKIAFLPHENLPKRTLDAIKERKKNGPSTRSALGLRTTSLKLPHNQPSGKLYFSCCSFILNLFQKICFHKLVCFVYIIRKSTS